MIRELHEQLVAAIPDNIDNMPVVKVRINFAQRLVDEFGVDESEAVMTALGMDVGGISDTDVDAAVDFLFFAYETAVKVVNAVDRNRCLSFDDRVKILRQISSGIAVSG